MAVVMIGVDPHKGSHTAVVIGAAEELLGQLRVRACALTGASAAIAAAVGPLLGGFLTTYLSWRVGFGLEVVVILVVLSQIRVVKDVPYTGPRHIDFVGAVLSVVGMGGVVLGILVWQEGGDYVACSQASAL